MKRKLELTFVLLLMIGALIFSRRLSRMIAQEASGKIDSVDVIIDAGHGGTDPGKVGINQALEKDINLEIAKKLEKLLKEKNISCKMVRTEDRLLAPEGSKQKKIEDMKERVRMINEIRPTLAVSIHQNSYTEESIKGAQVFYYKHSKKGEELAKHTFNPRLGITGGISILGTSGIVVPMSEEALISTIRVEMEMRKAQGDRVLLVTPGNYGQDFLKTYPWVRADHSVKCSNYVGKTLEFAAELGFDAILFVAHLGKFVKVSGGIMNTHSHEADCRAELLTAQAVRAGADLALAKKLLETGTTEEAVQILKEAGCLKEAMEKVTEKIAFYMNYHIEGRVQTEAIVFSSNEGLLGETPGAGELLERLREQEEKENRKE